MNLAKMNPLVLREKMKMKFGIVERIYLSGVSLKINCTLVEQKTILLGATLFWTTYTSRAVNRSLDYIGYKVSH